eukprot:PITA_04371
MAPRARDPAWAYVEMVDSQMQCKFCHRKIKEGPGGINRLKQHLAGIRGQITPCTSPEIGENRKQLLASFEKFKEDKARQREIEAEIGRKREIQKMMATNPNYDFEGSSSIPQTDTSNPFRYVPPSFGSVQDKGKGRMKKGDVTIKSYFTPSSPLDAHGPQVSKSQMQPTLDDHWKKELRETACEYIARWWYDDDIPFNASRSPYYEPMFDAIHAVGKGFKGPTMHDLRGYRLQKEIQSINEYLKEFKDSWARTGCTIMSDGWTDQRNRTIIKFLVFCPQGTMFLKSVDASDKVKDGHLLFQRLDQVVEEVGVANVVQVITNNASNYVLANKLLEEKHKTIFWTPCVAHCIDLMLEDIGKIDWVKIVDHAKSITKFIYNHSLILSLMRKHTGGKDIIRLAITRFATHFLTLKSMLSQHRNLQKMFSSDEWNQSKWSNKPEGKELKKKVYEKTSWRKATEIVKLVEPLVKLLRLVDGERLAMGFIYQAMDQAKEQRKTVYKDRVAKYGPIWAIIDEIWNNQLHRLIHAAGYFLNPRYHYKAKESGALRGEVGDGPIDCIDHMIPLEFDQLEIHRQVTTFSNASGTFGKNLAKIAREADEPAQWWEAFGGHCPELQRFAIRILSQTCSATGCERNWSVFERIHTKRRNRLDQKWLNDLVYVQYNLRLRRNQLLNKRPDSDPIVLEDIDPTSDWVVESRPAEFYPDEDLYLDLDIEASVELEHVVQLNANPDPPAAVSQPARTPVAGASSTQPRQKRNRISTLS